MRVTLEDGSLLERSAEGVYFLGGITIDESEGEELLKTGIITREPVAWFGAQMELKLRENDHKKHWSEMPFEYLLMRIRQEFIELEEAVCKYQAEPSEENAKEVIKEAADVGNFALMTADNVSDRPYKQLNRKWDTIREDERKREQERTDPTKRGPLGD